MGFIILLILLSSYVPTLMLIGLVILLIVDLLLVSVSSSVIPSFLSVARNRLLLPALVLRLNIVLLLILFRSFFGFVGYLRILVSSIPVLLFFVVTIAVLF